MHMQDFITQYAGKRRLRGGDQLIEQTISDLKWISQEMETSHELDVFKEAIAQLEAEVDFREANKGVPKGR